MKTAVGLMSYMKGAAQTNHKIRPMCWYEWTHLIQNECYNLFLNMVVFKVTMAN